MTNKFYSRWFFENFDAKALSPVLNRSFYAAEVDSRKVRSGQLFVPIVGENVDGHEFITQAVENGASTVLVEESWLQNNKINEKLFAQADFVVVESAMYALQALAKWHLSQLTAILKIALTGSNGKTTTKEIIASLLKEKYNLFVSHGNRNSDIGLPMEALLVNSEHEVAVFEMGMNRIDEIAELAAIVKPQIALITNIGTAHIEFFDSQEGIAFEKKKIFSQFTGSEIAILEKDSKFFPILSSNVPGTIKTFSLDNSDLDWENSVPVKMTYKGNEINYSLLGRHNVLNTAAAIAVAHEAGLNDQQILSGLIKVKPVSGRFEVIAEDKVFVNDSYNANLESMIAGLDWVQNYKINGAKHLVVGSMKELGGFSDDAHLELAKVLEKTAFSSLSLIGKETELIYRKMKEDRNVRFFQSREQIIKFLQKEIKTGDLVWVKGSHSLGLEHIVEELRGGANV